MCYPGIAFNTLTGKLSQDYKLEVKVVEVRTAFRPAKNDARISKEDIVLLRFLEELRKALKI